MSARAFKVGDKVRYSPQLAGEIVSIERRAGAWDGEFVAVVRWDFPHRQSYLSGEMDFAWLTLENPKINPSDGGRLSVGDWVRHRTWGWEGPVSELIESRLYGPLATVLVQYAPGDETGALSIPTVMEMFEHAEPRVLV